MIHWRSSSTLKFIFFGGMVFLSVCMYANFVGVSEAGAGDAAGSFVFPARGELHLARPPAHALFGMIYVNIRNNREYIFDGAEWVPHDASVDDYYNAKLLKAHARTLQASAAIPVDVKMTGLITPLMTQDEFCRDGDPACTPTGAHAKHGAYGCSVCHKVAGRLCFDSSGPAYGPGLLPTFDAAAKTCSNVACHTVKAGTFSYYFPDGSGEPVLNTVSYGGGLPRPSPSWYVTGAAGCTACHDDPPRNGSTGSNVWHSGYHANQGPTGAANQCQFCHPDASSPGNGIGDTITNASFHGNGTVNVQATFKSSCFGCH